MCPLSTFDINPRVLHLPAQLLFQALAVVDVDSDDSSTAAKGIGSFTKFFLPHLGKGDFL
jgi:hypothetical protein